MTAAPAKAGPKRCAKHYFYPVTTLTDSVETIHSSALMRERAAHARAAGKSLVLVPTMGALHEGHFALIERARKEGNHVTVSIFVNPTQFEPGEDFTRYPRDLEADCRLLERQKSVDLVFAPTVEEIYPDGIGAQLAWVDNPAMSATLCGRHRPGHFKGVLTVIAKLLAICQPHAAVFGLKDAQQFFMIRRTIRDLALCYRIIGEPTVREQDGLALSSRNAYLGSDERAQARILSVAVSQARNLVLSGEHSGELVEEAMAATIAQSPLAVLQYAEVVCTDSLRRVTTLEPGKDVLAAVAVFFGRTRLIDNAIIHVPLE